MNRDCQLIFEAYQNSKSKTFKELFPVGTRVKYKMSQNNLDMLKQSDEKYPNPNGLDKIMKEAEGIVIDDKLGYGFGEDEDNYWGLVELKGGQIAEARTDELTKIGSESDYIPNPESINRVNKATSMLTGGIKKALKDYKK